MGNKPRPTWRERMTFKTTKLRDAISFALAVGATLRARALRSPRRLPPDRKPPPSTASKSPARASSAPTSRPRSRCSRSSREDIEAPGLTSVGDILQNITPTVSALNTTRIQQRRQRRDADVDLRNLGCQPHPGAGQRPPLGRSPHRRRGRPQHIPTAAVERVEVLKDGASAIYGSDAIAGVVNIILRQNFDGSEVDAYHRRELARRRRDRPATTSPSAPPATAAS